MFPLGNTAARRPGRRIRVTLRSDDAEPITGALAALREVVRGAARPDRPLESAS
ncbi:MAG: hypothetical protein ACTH93_00350 [Pseudoclavibacter sp.]|uniref:hypothetical protein n=1 Tax=Pseudoclavibacter sp. CFCC 13796 TaxID=2615179 RepID=UPI0017879452|nr:hypothetical protein [Pseudoclavibacter sp. CFCC 13796]